MHENINIIPCHWFISQFTWKILQHTKIHQPDWKREFSQLLFQVIRNVVHILLRIQKKLQIHFAFVNGMYNINKYKSRHVQLTMENINICIFTYKKATISIFLQLNRVVPLLNLKSHFKYNCRHIISCRSFYFVLKAFASMSQ